MPCRGAATYGSRSRLRLITQLSYYRHLTAVNVLPAIQKLGELIEEIEGTVSDDVIDGLWLIYEHAYTLTDSFEKSRA